MKTHQDEKECASDILIFKTNIQSKEDVMSLEELFAPVQQNILDWSIDCEDIDNVLRIESINLESNEIIDLIKQAGYYCEELPD